jgi:hypothetical protein
MADQKTPSFSRTTEQMMKWIEETFEQVLYPAGFEDCILGVAEKFGGPPVVVLDLEKMLTNLEEQGMDHDEAIEYFEYNILGAYVGEQTPVYLHVPNFKTH